MDDDRPSEPLAGRGLVPHRLAGLALLGLFLAAMITAPVIAADIGSAAAGLSPAPATAGDDEDDEEEGSDGSEALVDRGHIVPSNLRPIGLDEEEALLGVWGDAPSEDED